MNMDGELEKILYLIKYLNDSLKIKINLTSLEAENMIINNQLEGLIYLKKDMIILRKQFEKRIKKRYLENNLQDLKLETELKRLNKVINKTNFEALIHKGYPLPGKIKGLRFSIDIDFVFKKRNKLMFEEEDFITLHKEMKKAGYHSRFDLRIKKEPTQDMSVEEITELVSVLHSYKEYGYKHPETGVLIEPHLHLVNPHTPIKFNVQEMFKTSKKIPNMQNIKVPRTEFLILIYAYHLFHHRGEIVLKELLTLKLIVENNLIDWQYLVKKSKQTNISALVKFYLNLGKQYLDLQIPFKTLKDLKKDSSKIQLILISLINKKRLMIKNKDFFLMQLYNSYLIDTKQKRLFEFLHKSLNNIINRK